VGYHDSNGLVVPIAAFVASGVSVNPTSKTVVTSGVTPIVAAGSVAMGAATAGCCTITFDDAPDQQFSGLTEDECRAKAACMDGTPAWVPGDCAG
jgi:hypothetical protein